MSSENDAARCDASGRPRSQVPCARLPALVVALASATLLWLASPTAHAQSSPSAADERGQLHFQAGNDSYHRGDYESALREFRIALELSGRAELHFNLASCLERLDREQEAADELEAYLAAAPEAPNRDALAERVTRLRARAAAHEATPPSDPPLAPMEQEGAGSSSEGAVSPTSAEAPAAQPHPVGWVVLGTGAASLIAFAVLGGLALAEDDALARECGLACSPARVSTLETLDLGADVTLGVGLGLVTLGVVLALTVQESTPSTGVSLSLGPSGLTVRF
ncbi:MAG: hypothetical protein U0234_21080 [Sandaracinus sp.]